MWVEQKSEKKSIDSICWIHHDSPYDSPWFTIQSVSPLATTCCSKLSLAQSQSNPLRSRPLSHGFAWTISLTWRATKFQIVAASCFTQSLGNVTSMQLLPVLNYSTKLFISTKKILYSWFMYVYNIYIYTVYSIYFYHICVSSFWPVCVSQNLGDHFYQNHGED